MSDPLSHCFSEARIRGLTLRNRLIKAATSLGMSKGGVPSPEFMRVHERLGEGGVGMTTLAYCAAEADGRLHEDMLYMHEGIRPELEALIDRVHATGAMVSGQLGHCGSFSKNRKLSIRRPLGPSRGMNSLGMAHGMPFAGALERAADSRARGDLRPGGGVHEERGLRCHRDPLRARLRHQPVHQPAHQQAHRRVRRIARKPHALRARGTRSRAHRRRRRLPAARQDQHDATVSREASSWDDSVEIASMLDEAASTSSSAAGARAA